MYKKVMVIDDNEIDLIIADRVIAKVDFAEEVMLMDSALDAIAYLKANTENIEALPSLIFLDINMPQMNGFQFLDAYSDLPDDVKQNCIIMMLTTSVHTADKDKVESNPYVRAFINKPLSGEKLKEID